MTRRFISEDVWQRADVYRHEYYEDTLGLLSAKKALIEFSPFKVGEVVAVAQCYEEAISPLDWVNQLIYKDEAGWKNKMFVRADLMPHQIRITNVRVERLQDISYEDCLREGIRKMTFDTFSFDSWKFFTHNPREAFAALIDKVSGKGSWERNPWVYAYEFELVKED